MVIKLLRVMTIKDFKIDNKTYKALFVRIGLVSLFFFGIFIFYLIFMKVKPANIDSYYYLQFYKKILSPSFHSGGLIEYIMYYMPLIMYLFPFINGYLLYKILRRFTGFKISLIAGVLFVIDPIIHFNQQFGLYDKNSLVIFSFLLIMNILFLKQFKWKIISISLLILSVFFAWFSWEGWVIVLMFIFIPFGIANIFESFFEKKVGIRSQIFVGSVVTILVLSIYGVIKYMSYFENFIYIREMWPVVFNLSGVWFAYFMFLITYTTIKIRQGKHIEMLCNHFYWLFVFNFFAGFFIYRFLIFTAISFYLLLGFAFFTEKNTIFFKSFMTILIFFMLLSAPFYTGDRYDDCNIKETILFAQQHNKTCLVSDWGKGHMYSYYTRQLDVRYKGHPDKENMLRDFTNYDWDCIYILDHDDRIVLDAMFNNESLILDKMDKVEYLNYEKNKTTCGFTVYYVSDTNTNFSRS